MTGDLKPYGWGCLLLLHTYCGTQAQDGWNACLKCIKIEGHSQYDEMITDVKKLIHLTEESKDD